MARYKDYSYDQHKLLPIRCSKQLLPGSFEYALHHVIEELDLAGFNARYENNETGAPAPFAISAPQPSTQRPAP